MGGIWVWKFFFKWVCMNREESYSLEVRANKMKKQTKTKQNKQTKNHFLSRWSKQTFFFPSPLKRTTTKTHSGMWMVWMEVWSLLNCILAFTSGLKTFQCHRCLAIINSFRQTVMSMWVVHLYLIPPLERRFKNGYLLKHWTSKHSDDMCP